MLRKNNRKLWHYIDDFRLSNGCGGGAPGGMTAYRSRNPSTTGATLTRGGAIGANNHLSAAVSNAAVANRDQSRVQVS